MSAAALIDIPELSPLHLSQLSRDTWGMYDSSAMAQLAPLANDPCFQMKFYKAPADDDEILKPQGYIPYGLKITPRSLIFGFYLPCIPNPSNLIQSAPAAFTVQITDTAMRHRIFDDPVSSIFLANYKPTFQSPYRLRAGSAPNLLTAPYPVTGSGIFMVEIQENGAGTTTPTRIELVFGVLERCGGM
jgi:hypothetical protein